MLVDLFGIVIKHYLIVYLTFDVNKVVLIIIQHVTNCYSEIADFLTNMPSFSFISQAPL